MPTAASRIVVGLLLAIHAGLGAWALVGFAELLLPVVPWPRLSNPLFTHSMLLLQWTLIATAAAVFIGGYVARWKCTPVAMLVIYGMMALTCAYQTFFVLTDPARFRAMAIEYVEYAVVLLLLFRWSPLRARFS